MKIVGSWSKPDLGDKFIARKKVDWSIFEYGSHIPLEFIEDFQDANEGKKIALGEKYDISIIIEDKEFKASISNIDRKNFNGDTLQIRYDSNNDLKAFLTNKLQVSYNYLNEERTKKKEINDKGKVIVPDDIAEYLDFYKTDNPFCYKVDIIKSQQQGDQNMNESINVWWVNQGITISKEKNEGCLWAPIKNKAGRTQYHWETMAELKKDDIVLHYANGYLRYISRVLDQAIEAPAPESLKDNNQWNRQGRLVHVDYIELNPQIPLGKISKSLLPLNIKEGPIDSYGGVKQGYLFRFTKEALLIMQKLSTETKWPDFSKIDNIKEVTKTMVGEVAKNPVVKMNTKESIERISKYIKSKGFTYDNDIIMNLYLAIKAKPFVILAGTSGTGKSKLVKLFSEAVGSTSENGRYKLIPVKPDWSDSTDLLGYRDLYGKFHPGVLTSFIKKAMDDTENPYFICLDEMNLARVEYYFSDILSVMETRTWNGESILTDKLLSEELFGDNEEAKKLYQNVYIPENLYIIGTVNMDETTFPFSKKVLDRANTIEFSEVNLEHSFNSNSNADPIELNNEFFKSKFLKLDDCGEHEEIVLSVITILKNINESLKNSNLHFGYRIRDEICYYTIYNDADNLITFDNAMDYEILQKILPRIQGSSGQIKRAIIDMFKICINNSVENFNDGSSNVNDAMSLYIEGNPIIPYKKAAAKLAFMMRRFEEDGFTSYWL